MQRLPLYEAKITDEIDGIMKISLVDYPATESDFFAFKDQKQPLMYAVQNEDKHILFGVLMRADYPIYRIGVSGFEYNIIYSKETVKLMAEKLMFDNNQNRFNVMHEPGSDISGINCFQIFLKDVEKGVNPVGFEDIEDGSLFGAFQVYNEAVWQAVKDGTFKGFSIEGYFDIQEVENKQNKKQKNSMSKLKEALRKLLADFAEVSTDKGTLEYEGELIVGVEVSIDGEPAADGEYIAEDGRVIVVENGRVVEIREAEAPAEEEEGPEAAPEVIENAEEEVEVPANEEVTPEEVVDIAEEVAEDVVEEQTRDFAAEIDALRAEIEDLRTQLAELLGKPADEPIVEEFEAVKNKKEKMSKAERIASYMKDMK